MTTIRVARRHRFTAIDRRTINDDRLSFGARGLLVWLLDKPDDWSTTVERLADASPQGEYAVRGLVRELEACGYLARQRVADPATKRYVAEWEVREVPEPCAETADGTLPKPSAETADGKPPTHARKPRMEPSAKTADITEDGLLTEDLKLTPALRGAQGGDLAVRSVFESENTQALQALSGGMAEPGPQFVKAMAAGGWLRLVDVPDMPAAVQAWWDSLEVKPFTKKSDAQKLGREAARNGQSPGQFLFTLCTANVVSPRGLDLARNRAARADLPGMSGMRGPVVGKRAAMAAAGKRLHEERKAAKRKAAARNVLDAESEEVL